MPNKIFYYFFISHVSANMALRQPRKIFCQWVDGKNQNRIGFPFFRDNNRNEINLGIKMRIGPKCKDQKCIYGFFVLREFQDLLFNYQRL